MFRFFKKIFEKAPEWYEPEDPTPREICPCCDYVTLPERGNYLICPICFWEDEGGDIDEPELHSGPNHMTLRQGRTNFQKYGACDEKMVKNVLPVTKRNQYEYKQRNI